MRILLLVLILNGLALRVSAQLSLIYEGLRRDAFTSDSLNETIVQKHWQDYVKKHKVKSLTIARGLHKYASWTWHTKARTMYMQEVQRYDRDGRLIYLAEKYLLRVKLLRPTSSRWLNAADLDRVEYWFTYDDGGRLIQEDSRRSMRGEIDKSRKIYLYGSDNMYVGNRFLETGNDTNVFELKSEEKYTYGSQGKQPAGYMEIEYPRPDSPVVQRRLNMDYDTQGKLLRKYGEALRYQMDGYQYEKVEWVYEYNGPDGQLSLIKSIDESDTSGVPDTWEIRYDGREKVITHRYRSFDDDHDASINRYNELGAIAEYQYFDEDHLEDHANFSYDADGRLLYQKYWYVSAWDGEEMSISIFYKYSSSGERRKSEIEGDQGDVLMALPDQYKWEYWDR